MLDVTFQFTVLQDSDLLHIDGIWVLCFNCFCFSKKFMLTDGSVFGLHLYHGFPDPVDKVVNHTSGAYS